MPLKCHFNCHPSFPEAERITQLAYAFFLFTFYNVKQGRTIIFVCYCLVIIIIIFFKVYYNNVVGACLFRVEQPIYHCLCDRTLRDDRSVWDNYHHQNKQLLLLYIIYIYYTYDFFYCDHRIILC